jgi:hypothetical protein
MSTEAMSRQHNGPDRGQGASEKASQAASTASEAASTAKEETASVIHTAKEQVGSLMEDARGELRTQADDRTSQLAEQVRRVGEQFKALAEGRPDDAGPLADYVRQGQQQVSSFASRLDTRGAQGVIDDVVAFGRRRPGTFLLAAGALGFAVGRLARVGAAESHDSSSPGYSNRYSATPREEYRTTPPVGPGRATTASGTAPSSTTMPAPGPGTAPIGGVERDR